MRFILPFPDPKLNPNRSKGLHWGATSALRKKARQDGFYAAREAMGGIVKKSLAENIPITITFVQPDKRIRDRDNLLSASKSAIDGIALALEINDNKFNPVTIKREYGKKPGCVIVEIEI